MTQEEIIEGTKLIALYCGFEYVNDDPEYYKDGYYFKGSNEEESLIFELKEFEYYSDLSWSVIVLEIIEKNGWNTALTYNSDLKTHQCSIYNNIVQEVNGSSQRREVAVFIALVEFVKLYNSQPN